MALYIGIKNLIGKGTAWLRSKWSTIVTQLKATFRYRVAGGSDNALLPESNGRAILQKVYGKTVKWNQLVDTTTTSVTLVSGNKYYTMINGTASVVTGDGSSVAVTGGTDMVIDLTAAEIDSLTTVEQVEAWLALNVGAQDYYPYDKGSLVSFKGSALQVKKDGAVIDEVDLSGAYINVWDEEWENGIYNSTNGEPVNTQQFLNQIRSKNRIKVLPNTPYFCNQPGSKGLNVLFYDAEDNYITGKNKWNIQRFTTPENAYYLRFYFASVYGNTYKHDICINVSNADINGTYYPHALQSAGSVTDEDTATELTKKLRQVTITTEILKYFRNSVGSHINIGYTDTHIADGAKVLPSATTVRNAITTLYGYTITGQDAAWITDMRIGIAANGQLAISNNSFTSLAEFQALCPFDIIYEVEDYITISHDTPMQYAVDKYSTEELLVPASVAGEPTSTALVADIEYQAK